MSFTMSGTSACGARTHVLRCVVALAGAMAFGHPAFAETFTNPIIGQGADPWVTQWKGQYFYARSAGGRLYVDRATKLQNIGSGVGQAVWAPPTGTAYSQNLWAPELHYLDNKWYMYVAADDGDNANHRMHVLEGDSQDPQGTYTYKGKIAAPTDRYAIDGTVFETGGLRYFVWSGWQGTTDGRQDLYIAPMSNPWTISGERVLISQPDYAWEKHGLAINEGPTVLKKDGNTHIIYSGSAFWENEYALGQLTLNGRNVLNKSSWIKKPTPVFSETSNVVGTGHASFVKSPDRAEDWIVYHAHDNPNSFTGGRDVRIQPFGFNTDNSPNFGSPVDSGVALQEPSGRAVVTFIPNGGFDRTVVTSPGGAGIASGVESFGNQGEVGVIDNTGRFFAPIAGGDGQQVAYIGAGESSALTQDIGLIVQPGTFSLSAGFAISSDQAGDALADPTTFKLVLESVGFNARGVLNEGDVVVLGETEFSSTLFNASSFTYFSTSGIIPDSSRLDTLLRIGIHSIGNGSADWEAKLDNVGLAYSTAVPEPAALGAIYVAMTGLLLARRRREKGVTEYRM